MTMENGGQFILRLFFQKFLQSLVLNTFASYILQIVTNIVEKSKMFRVDQNILRILYIMHKSERYLFFSHYHDILVNINH